MDGGGEKREKREKSRKYKRLSLFELDGSRQARSRRPARCGGRSVWSDGDVPLLRFPQQGRLTVVAAVRMPSLQTEDAQTAG